MPHKFVGKCLRTGNNRPVERHPVQIARERLGMSQAELARQAHTSRQQILKIETRKIWDRGLPYDWAQRLAGPLKISPIELMTDSDVDGLLAGLLRDWVRLPNAEKLHVVTYLRVRVEMVAHDMAAKAEPAPTRAAVSRQPKRQRK